MKINDTLSVNPKKIFQRGNIEIHRCGLSLLIVENNNTVSEVLHPQRIKSAGFLNHLIDIHIQGNNNNEGIRQ